jgi:hypothetical protein
LRLKLDMGISSLIVSLFPCCHSQSGTESVTELVDELVDYQSEE